MPLVTVYGRGEAPPRGALKLSLADRESWMRRLRPEELGPVEVTPFTDPRRFRVERLIHAWVYLGVFKGHADAQNEPRLPDWLDWAQAGFASRRLRLHPFGPQVQPLYTLHCGRKLNAMQARHDLLAPLLADAWEREAADELRRLRAVAARVEQLAIYDPQGYRPETVGLSLRDAYYNAAAPLSAGLLLALLLSDDKPWTQPFQPERLHVTPPRPKACRLHHRRRANAPSPTRTGAFTIW